ncbi:MAG: (Fe-S)-binding protein [Burkholderiales bacterium]|nr:(Fe-S)-binding protein [Burkholderiales bacterium]
MRVGLYATCLADTVRPDVASAAMALLEQAGCEVVVPVQSCCGQPAYNGGERALAKRLAWHVVQSFADLDYVVLPSGSCTAMMRMHYPRLFEGDARLAEVDAFATRVYELSEFLVSVLQVALPPAPFEGAVTYHDSCSGLRELGIKSQPRQLLACVPGLKLIEAPTAEQCCGFGGTFSVKFSEVSCAIADRKCADLTATGAGTWVGGDLGCLLHLEGRMRAQGDQSTQLLHYAEILAGTAKRPA